MARTTATRTLSKIIWAVDPFAKDFLIQRSSVAALEQVHSGNGQETEIIPIYVWGTPPLEGAARPSREDVREKTRIGEEAIRALLSTVEGASTWKVHPLKIIQKPFFSIREAARELVLLAKKIHADMIVTSTHARKGPPRWILGSFAETLSLISDVPLFVAPPNWKGVRGSRAVLFPTDFSEESLAAYRHLLDTAEKLDWSITIFHRVEFPFNPSYDFTFTGWDFYEDARRLEAENRQKDAERLVAIAEKRGVRADIRIDTVLPETVTDSILKRLRKNYALVAMAPHSGLWSEVFLGRTTRNLLRHSPVPVWILHPAPKTVKGKRVVAVRSGWRGGRPRARPASSERRTFL